jgi:predicted ATP-grasp superfamily ATP-dependent carboligase
MRVAAVRMSRAPDSRGGRLQAAQSERWLVKPLRSGGGHDVRPWDGKQIVRNTYLQEWIAGVPASIVFVAAARRAVPLGVSRQLIGDENFGAAGYRYCGNILAPADDAQFPGGAALAGAARRLADVAADAFALVGVNGVDFIAAGADAVPIEVNPRWCSSMELVERVNGVSVFGAHAAACERGELPSSGGSATTDPPHEAEERAGAAPRNPNPSKEHERALGKAVVYARTDVVVGDTDAWLDDPMIRDVPRPGERIGAGRPICTVFARAADDAGCYAALVQRARALYAMLDSGPEGPPLRRA